MRHSAEKMLELAERAVSRDYSLFLLTNEQVLFTSDKIFPPQKIQGIRDWDSVVNCSNWNHRVKVFHERRGKRM